MEEKRKIQQSSNDFEMSSLFVPLPRMNNFQLGGKHKEAFSTLVKSLVQMTCIDFTNFLKLDEFTI